MATRTLPGFVAIYRDHHRETRSLAPTGHALAQLMRAALAAFIESRSRQADREIARVLGVRVADLPRLRCSHAIPPRRI